MKENKSKKTQRNDENAITLMKTETKQNQWKNKDNQRKPDEKLRESEENAGKTMEKQGKPRTTDGKQCKIKDMK